VSEIPARLRRAPTLEVHDAQDGLVVFDPTTDRVHHLNTTAAVLYELCDVSRTPTELASMVRDLYGLDDLPLPEVEAGLRELLREHVLIADPSRESD